MQRLLAVGLSLLLLSGCFHKPAPMGPPPPPGPPSIKIGVITTRSGPLAAYGDQTLHGLQLGLEYATKGSNQVAGRHLELLIRDDQGKPEVGAALATRLVDKEGAEILQGTASSVVAAELVAVARQRQRLLVVAPAADDALTGRLFNKYVFRVASSTSQSIMAGAGQAAQLGKSVAWLAPDQQWGTSTVRAWQAVLQRVAPDVQRFEPVFVPLDTSDFTSYLKKVADQHPEVLVVHWAGDATVRLFQQMAAMGLFQKLKVITPLGDRVGIRSLTGASGLYGILDYYYSFPKNEVNDWLVGKHTERYGEPPDLFVAAGFDAGLAIALALQQTGGDTNGDRLVQAMEGLRFNGAKGPLSFRKQDHQAMQPLYVATLSDQQGQMTPRLLREVPIKEVTPPVQTGR